MTMRTIKSLGRLGLSSLAFSVFLWFYADPSGFGIFHLASLVMLVQAKLCFTALVFAK